MRVYLDSCIVIYLLEAAPEHVAFLEEESQRLDAHLVVSDLVPMETLVKPVRDHDLTLQKDYERWFAQMECLSLPGRVFDTAAQICAQFRLRSPDALHVGTAMDGDCDEFWTNDLKIATKDLPIRIRLFSAP